MYLKNRDGQVVAAGQDGSCEWQTGSVRQHPDRITTSSSGGTSTFRLFDHITVSDTTRHAVWFLSDRRFLTESPQLT